MFSQIILLTINIYIYICPKNWAIEWLFHLSQLQNAADLPPGSPVAAHARRLGPRSTSRIAPTTGGHLGFYMFLTPWILEFFFGKHEFNHFFKNETTVSWNRKDFAPDVKSFSGVLNWKSSETFQSFLGKLGLIGLQHSSGDVLVIQPVTCLLAFQRPVRTCEQTSLELWHWGP